MNTFIPKLLAGVGGFDMETNVMVIYFMLMMFVAMLS